MALLDPKPDERILDLGCGTGELTQAIAEKGADVIGLDSSPHMLEQARQLAPGLRFIEQSALSLTFQSEFDAVFSNAALHWMKDNPRAVAQGVAAALKPQGRFVLEMGAAGNVQNVIDGIYHGLAAIGRTPTEAQYPWYFPKLGAYCSLLEEAGLEVAYAVTFDRPSPLHHQEHGLRTWLMMFGKTFYAGLSDEELENALQVTEAYLQPRLYQNEQWVADYRRLRVVAHKRP
jgi:trans-aconitate 2-methyltransferase